MDRREMLAGLGASLLMNAETGQSTPSFLELRFWRMHNSAESQTKRVAAYLEHGYGPALARAGTKLAGAFSNVIGPEGPQFVTLVRYASLAALEQTLIKLQADG